MSGDGLMSGDRAASIAADRLIEWVLAAPDEEAREARYRQIHTDGVARTGFVQLMTQVWLTAQEEGRPLDYDQLAELLDVLAHPEEDPPTGYWRRGATAGLVIDRLSARQRERT